MNEIIALNGASVESRRDSETFACSDTGCRHPPRPCAELYGSRWDRRHSATQLSYRPLLCECLTTTDSISDNNDETPYLSAITLKAQIREVTKTDHPPVNEVDFQQ